MRNSTKILLSIASIALLSGCDLQNRVDNTFQTNLEKPVIDQSISAIDTTSIKTIPDISSIAIEWARPNDNKITGYYVYRAEAKDGEKLTRIATLDSRYTSHYLDVDLKSDTTYIYKISAKGQDKSESVSSDAVTSKTLPTIESLVFVKAISHLPRQVKILWRPHENQRVAKYIIEKRSVDNPNWSEIATVKGRLQVEYIDNGLDDGATFMYRVKAVTFDAISSKASEEVSAVTKPLPLNAENFMATTDLPKKIKITWTPSKTPDVISYNLYGSNYDWSVFTKIQNIPANAAGYEHLVNEDGAVRFYKITAVDADNLESKIAKNPIMGQTLAKPEKPVVTLAQIEDNKVILNWKAGDARAKGFVVYKTVYQNWFQSTKSEFAKLQATDAPIQRIEDKDILRGVQYKYSVASVDQNGLISDESSEASLILPEIKTEK